jgi:hypothetical protein
VHQNSRSISRRCAGAPGDFIGDRPVNAVIHPAGLPIDTSTIEVVRRPVESALRPRVVVVRQSGQVGDAQPGRRWSGLRVTVPCTALAG